MEKNKDVGYFKFLFIEYERVGQISLLKIFNFCVYKKVGEVFLIFGIGFNNGYK